MSVTARDLDGRVAIVTGAGGGIGRASALALAGRGATVLAVGRTAESVEATTAAIAAAGGAGRAVVADVTSSADVRGFVAAAVEEFGRIDVLFNNAGAEGPVVPLAEYPEDAFEEIIAVNLRGTFLGLRHVLPVMLAAGRGSIVNTGSLGSERGLPGTAAYNAAKHAVLGLTRTAAVEAAAGGVRVNAVLPGLIDTRMLRSLADILIGGESDAAVAALGRIAPQGRPGTAAEVAEVVCFLASDAAAFVNGVALPIDGAALASLGQTN